MAFRRPPQEIAQRLLVILNQVTADEMENQVYLIAQSVACATRSFPLLLICLKVQTGRQPLSGNVIVVIYQRVLQHCFAKQEFQFGILFLHRVEISTGSSHRAYQLQFDS